MAKKTSGRNSAVQILVAPWVRSLYMLRKRGNYQVLSCSAGGLRRRAWGNKWGLTWKRFGCSSLRLIAELLAKSTTINTRGYWYWNQCNQHRNIFKEIKMYLAALCLPAEKVAFAMFTLAKWWASDLGAADFPKPKTSALTFSQVQISSENLKKQQPSLDQSRALPKRHTSTLVHTSCSAQSPRPSSPVKPLDIIRRCGFGIFLQFEAPMFGLWENLNYELPVKMMIPHDVPCYSPCLFLQKNGTSNAWKEI